jgi:endonuclease/exonuclease/phosphatase family metal-dependent hydrolase
MVTAGGIRVLTWNVHGGVGMDGVQDYTRAIDCLMGLDADIVALQELDGRKLAAAVTPFEDFRRRLGLHALPVAAITTEDGDYGQLLLSRWPFVASEIHDISLARYEPRRAIVATVRTRLGALRVIATHLGLRTRERRWQAEKLCALAALSDLPTVLLGDFNDWNRFQTSHGLLERVMPAFTRGRTFPSRRPVFALDRIYCRPSALLGPSRVIRNAHMISDHLPLVAELV